jgi:outer membrane immunogenic protein
MKRILLASAALLGTAVSAQAADLAVKAPYYKAPLVSVYNWTGFYIGVNAGVGIGRDRVTHSYTGDSLYLTPQGGFGGGQIGYNWQGDSLLGPIVYGLEADIQGSGLTGGGANVVGPLQTVYGQKSDWFGTVRGRVGLATGPVLSYFTGGFAYGNVKTTITEGGVTAFSDSRMATGWTIGSGVEAALGGNWTGKIEYLYLNLGNRSDAFATPTQLTNTELRENLFRVGLNYRIGGNSVYTPVAAANWTGWYLGGNIGSGTGRDRTTLTGVTPVPEQFNLAPDGINGGAQIGYNWHRDPVQAARPIRTELDLEDRISLCRPRLSFDHDPSRRRQREQGYRAHLPHRPELSLQQPGCCEVLISATSAKIENPGLAAGVFVCGRHIARFPTTCGC